MRMIWIIHPVSIPIGFSSSLQPWPTSRGWGSETLVSIPIGFSSSLQRHRLRPKYPRTHSFNPYRVFKFVATASRGFAQQIAEMVSIPIGFSSSLQRPPRLPSNHHSGCFNPYRVFKFVATKSMLIRFLLFFRVSIPIGFSSSLQPYALDNQTPSRHLCFNPYRVFKFVATSQDSASHYYP